MRSGMGANNPDPKFEVGDSVRFVLRNGKVEEGVVRAVIQTTGEI
jgi:hypothetical protein